MRSYAPADTPQTESAVFGQLSAGEERSAITATLTAAARSNTFAALRAQAQLVRHAAGQWRTGRLDLVLGGAFDLLQGVTG